MPRSKRSTSDQHREFVKAARELGCDESEDTFDRVLKKVSSAPPPKSVQKRKMNGQIKPQPNDDRIDLGSQP